MSPLVRDAIQHYHDLLASKHAASTRETLARAKTAILRPSFVDRRSFEEILRAATLLHRGLVTAADRLAKDVALRRKLGLPDYLDPLIEIDRDRGAPSLVGRFDAFVDRGGVFKVIEYNASPGFNYDVPRAFPTLPITQEFAQRFRFAQTNLPERMRELLVLRDGASERPAVIGVPVASKPASKEKYGLLGWSDSEYGRGFQVIDATLDEFKYDGSRLYVEREGRVDIDLLSMVWEDLIDWSQTNSPMFDAIRSGSVRVLTGVSRGLLCGYKHTFELLSNPEYASMFEPEVAAVLAKHVPWTRAVRNAKTTYRGKTIDLLPFVADSRERWVLKPSGGSRGLGVVVGYTCTDSVWRQSLKRALSQKFVVQERVLGSVEEFPFASADGDGFVLQDSTPTCEPFLWSGTTAADALVRLSSTGNHTLGSGGSETVLWIFDE